MSRYLLLDIGAGTLDMLWFDDRTGEHFKAVVASPVRTVAEAAAALPGNLVVTGGEMGGGPVTRVLQERAAQSRVVLSRSASATVHHDPERVLAMGLAIVSDDEAEALGRKKSFSRLHLADIRKETLRSALDAMGVSHTVDTIGACAQDHGVPPAGVSHLDFRHRGFVAALDATPRPESLLHEGGCVPETFNRLRFMADTARKLPCGTVYVMDSGMAAILGASMDPACPVVGPAIVLDIATSHTVGAAVCDGDIAGFFEYHTKDVTRERLESMIRGLAGGRLRHDVVLSEGGHGAYHRRDIAFGANGVIVATGPKRARMQGSALPIVWGAPWGDNMMTGTVGLLTAIRRRGKAPDIRFPLTVG
jgi:uncharacterized protein (DUF1786 family)